MEKTVRYCTKHPDRKATARGLCHACYNTVHKYGSDKTAPCHPGRKLYDRDRGLCESCYHKWLREHDPKYKEKEKVRYARTKEHRQAVRRKRLYGIDPDVTASILERQNGLCDICGKVMGKPSLDHNHSTGKMRAFLCDHCNRGLGYFRDDIEIMLNACLYLERHK